MKALGKNRIVGLVPAAGHARRISPLPMSKELYPIAMKAAAAAAPMRPKVVSQYLLEGMASAGIREAFVIIRPGKWDIPAFFGDGGRLGMRLAYLSADQPLGVPFTLNQAYPFVKEATIALGFPDLLFWPENAFSVILKRLNSGQADIVLGLFPTDEPERVGIVDMLENGNVRGIYEKSMRTDLQFMWGLAVWRPTFTEFLHAFVQKTHTALKESAGRPPGSPTTCREIPIGDVVHAGIQAGLRVEAEVLPGSGYIDIGTPEGLGKALALHVGPA